MTREEAKEMLVGKCAKAQGVNRTMRRSDAKDEAINVLVEIATDLILENHQLKNRAV